MVGQMLPVDLGLLQFVKLSSNKGLTMVEGHDTWNERETLYFFISRFMPNYR